MNFLTDEEMRNLESNAFPVKYMVVKNNALLRLFGAPCWRVINTCDAECTTVCVAPDLQQAHKIARRMNEAEGYTYHPDWGK